MMTHEEFMRQAIGEARKARGRTHPNPAVGCVIVQNNTVVATGRTSHYGGPHAEINALTTLRESGIEPDSATTLYVTLEPCSTEGQTPPCTQAIIDAAIPRVVIGTVDPNPHHEGQGLEILRNAGIEVFSGILEEECSDINLIFNHWIRRKTPFIAAKVATTLDGRIATRGGLSKWITGPQARENVMYWRRYFPAIAVGAGTIMADNPRLTARIENEEEWSPIRIVFDRNLITLKDDLPNVYTDAFASRTIVVTSHNKADQIMKWADRLQFDYWVLSENHQDGGIPDFIQRCHDASINGVYVEGGSQLLSAFLRYHLLHYLFAYRAPKLLADNSGLSPFLGQEPISMQHTIQLKDVRHESFGPDQLMRGYFVYPE